MYSSGGTGALTKIDNANDLIAKIVKFGEAAIYLLIGAAVVIIVWNVVKYLISGSKPEEKSAASMNILWDIIGLAIIVSIWGLVGILTNTFNVGGNTAPKQNFPTVNFLGN